MASLTKTLYVFFARISAYFQRKLKGIDNKTNSTLIEEDYLFAGDYPEGCEAYNYAGDVGENEAYEEDEISLARRTLTTKLYMIEQKIELFKHDFPNEYSQFLGEIEELRKAYDSNLEGVKQQLTFEIDPEFNGKMLWEIEKLDKTIQKFIESDVKFSILSKRLQMLIVKLNILYNVSISHPNEADKVISQVNRALVAEMEIAQDFKDCDHILSDSRLRDRLVTLISYADYEIFKTILRNSNFSPEQIVENLVLLTKFKEFDYMSAFKAFVEDELSDLDELLYSISDVEYRKTFEKKVRDLLKETAYVTDVKAIIFDVDFWNDVFEAESSILEFLKISNVKDKTEIKVKLISRMNIDVKESEVLTLAKTNAYLALTSVYSATRDERILLLIKLFKNVSDEVSYKGIYFLLLLFDAMSVIQSTPNSLSRHMEKYVAKYPYDNTTIKKKKLQVLNSSNKKQYVTAFPLDDDEKKVIAILKDLNIDFKVENGNVCINSFYFNGLENVFLPITTKAQNTTN